MMFIFAILSLCAIASVNSQKSSSDWKSRTIYQVLTDRYAGPSTQGCDLYSYCGGTYAGLVQNLDYIQDMGFDAIWISPVVENTPGGYHGYWAKNISAVNENFGSEQDLVNLIFAAHEKGMWVMVDVVGNHMGGTISEISGFAPFNQPEHYHDCNGCDSSCDITDFSTLYSSNCEHCRLAGLPDLNQDNSWVAEQLIQWISSLVKKYHFDGIRVDTVPEVKPAFWKRFNQAADCYAVGEVFSADMSYVAPYQGQALDGVLSYPMFFSIRSVFAQGGNFKQLQDTSDAMPGAFSDVSLLGTFVDNHDNARFLNLRNDHTAYKNALMHVLFSSGIPIIYYGSEQGFSGGSDPANREILWISNFDRTGDLYQFIKSVVGIRKQYSAWMLPYPKWYWVDAQVGVFSRGTGMLVATTNVGKSGSDQTRHVPLAGFTNGALYCDALDSSYCTNVAGGALDITLVGGRPRVLVAR